MRVMFPILIGILAATTVEASDCPPPPDHGEQLDALIAQVQTAADAEAARDLTNQMWALWADAPNDQAQEILDRGMTRRSGFDLLGAIQDFDRLVQLCPSYAEGYNQRAFAHYLRQDYGAALVDLDAALVLSPRHIGALSGKALSLYGLGRLDEARIALSRALELNPWLPERGLAAPGGPLAPKGQDI